MMFNWRLNGDNGTIGAIGLPTLSSMATIDRQWHQWRPPLAMGCTNGTIKWHCHWRHWTTIGPPLAPFVGAIGINGAMSNSI
jgi:hypothetical protein